MKYWLLSTISFARGVGHFRRIVDREGGITHQPMLVPENQSDCRFMWSQNIRSPSFSFVTIHAMRLIEGQTDRQTELRQQYRALHYMQSRGKNEFISALLKDALPITRGALKKDA